MLVVTVNCLCAGVLAALGLRLVRDHLDRARLAPKPFDPNARRNRLAALMPEGAFPEGVEWLSGAWRTSQSAVTRWVGDAGVPAVRAFGTLLPVDKMLDKLTLVFGKPGAGKTVALVLLLAELCVRGFAERSLGRKFRLVVVDPTDSFRAALWSLVPTDVPIFDMSLQSEGGLYWAIGRDVETEGQAATLARDLTAESRANTKELFWTAKVAQTFKYLALRFIRAGSKDWRVSDLMSAVTYQGYVAGLLAGDRQLRNFAENDMAGRLGRDLHASVTAVSDQFLTSAGLDQAATRGVSMTEFLALDRAVLVVRFREDMIASQGAMASAMLKCLVTKLLMRQVKKGTDRTVVFIDEGASMPDLVPSITAAARKGRGSGVGVVFSALGVPALAAAYTEPVARELQSLAALTVCLHADADTAEAFSKYVGDTEAMVDSTSVATGQSWGRGGGPGGGNWNVGGSTQTTVSKARVVRRCVLPSEVTNLPGPDSVLSTSVVRGFSFTADTGAWDWEISLGDEFARLPPVVPRPPVPDRPDAPLKPLSLADLARLNLPLVDPGDPEGKLLDALRRHGQV